MWWTCYANYRWFQQNAKNHNHQRLMTPHKEESQRHIHALDALMPRLECLHFLPAPVVGALFNSSVHLIASSGTKERKRRKSFDEIERMYEVRKKVFLKKWVSRKWVSTAWCNWRMLKRESNRFQVFAETRFSVHFVVESIGSRALAFECRENREKTHVTWRFLPNWIFIIPNE